MKKIILLSVLLMTGSILLNAQEAKRMEVKKCFLDFSAGPSFPIGAFASANTSNTVNSHAGFSETGYKLNLNLGCRLNENFGIISQLLYSKHKLDISRFGDVGASTDHWKYYGVLAGPMVMFPLGNNTKVELKAIAGVNNVNSPSVDIDGASFIKEKWTTAFAFQFGSDIKYNFGNNTYVTGGIDYSYMKPTFNISISDGSNFYHSKTQEMGVVVISAGVGINL